MRLIGGETAEMPGLYAGRLRLSPASRSGRRSAARSCRGYVSAGDVLLGLPSSGLHSNGFSLVRRVVAATRARLGRAAPFAPGRSLGQALLEPTRIYVRPI
jgi:phosphoribosylformylglycinamidine cyclo-ligase